jgi:type I restriction enzyme, S subunit
MVVMRSGILQHTVPAALVPFDAAINQDMRAFSVRKGIPMLADYLAIYLQARNEALLELVKWGTTVQSMNTAELEDFPVILPPLEIQRKLVSEITAARERIASERAAAAKLAADTAREVEEMILGHRPVGSIASIYAMISLRKKIIAQLIYCF